MPKTFSEINLIIKMQNQKDKQYLDDIRAKSPINIKRRKYLADLSQQLFQQKKQIEKELKEVESEYENML